GNNGIFQRELRLLEP
ncbi:hypothetical protein BVZ80_01740B, partial [Haemophilus influenzae]